MPKFKTSSQTSRIETEFSDRDIMVDLLNSIKSLNTLYGTFSTEASNNDLLKKVKSLSTEIADEQRAIFNTLFEKGWYTLEKEDATKINTTIQKFKDYKSQISKKGQ